MFVILAVLVFDSALLGFFAPQTQAFVEKVALSSLQTV